MTTARDILEMQANAARRRLARLETKLAVVTARVEAKRRLGGVAREDLAEQGRLQVAVSATRVALAFYGALITDPQSSAEVPPSADAGTPTPAAKGPQHQ